jgi:hypothetical protein
MAVLAVSTRWTVLPFTGPTFQFVWVSAALAFVWLGTVVLSISKFGKHGALALLGAPFAFFWPAMYVVLSWSCRHGYECL